MSDVAMIERRCTLTTKDAAEYLGVTPATVRTWRRRGTGPRGYRVPGGHTILYRVADLDSWVDSLEVVGGGA